MTTLTVRELNAFVRACVEQKPDSEEAKKLAAEALRRAAERSDRG